MAELKFINPAPSKRTYDCCDSSLTSFRSSKEVSRETRLPGARRKTPSWITGTVATAAGMVPVISTDLTRTDYWEHIKCRVSAFRNDYKVAPGLYAVGSPDGTSEVFVSANYKLSFDHLRESLKGLNAWVLVLNTKGINVWCAAGKGAFGTEELIKRISQTGLEKVVDHRRIVVPQLGAPGISAHIVKKVSGFRVLYGPVRAQDIGAYIAAGNRATREMRRVEFPLLGRLVLTPMEINPAMKKYYPWFALAVLALFGLQPSGIFFREALTGGLPFLLLGLTAVLTGAFITPVLLPYIPFRSFALKGWITGMLFTFIFERSTVMARHLSAPLLTFAYLFFPLASSYISLQFTGSTTFTGISGVRKELRVAIPLYIAGTVASLILLAVYKLGEWRLI